jgi:hypothetical protein
MMVEIWEFVKLLLGRWVVRILLLLAIGSALSKYFPGHVVPSWVSHGIFDLALIVASWDVFKKKQKEISDLRKGSVNRPDLVIYPQDGSRFYVRKEGDRAVATCVHLDLSIANKGRQISIINRYLLEIKEMGQTFSDLCPRPMEQIRGRRALFLLGKSRWLTEGNIIKVEAGKSTPRGMLPLEVPDVLPDDITSIHCILTVCDDAGTRASCEVQVGGS